MAEIPPDISSSAAQAGFQAREVARGRDARRSDQSDASIRQSRAAGETGETVETTDEDMAVFSDAEGGGGRGRPFESAGESDGEEGKSVTTGLTRDENGRLRLDVKA